MDHFLDQLSQLEGDEQLRSCIDQMRSSLAQEGRADLRNFWEVRSRCFELFKEPINPTARAHYWKEFCELSSEAKGLALMAKREVAFTSEQFELAVSALEAELESPDFSIDEELPAAFRKAQAELDWLSSRCARLRALRTDLARIAVRGKRQLFQRLSQMGERLFPRRKELVSQVSAQFEAKVDRFVKEFDTRTPLHELREQIKSLQALAKRLTLESGLFSKARLMLSECWDQVREEGRRRKEHRVQKQEEAREANQQLVEQVMALGQKIDDPQVSGESSAAELERLLRQLKGADVAGEQKEVIEQARTRIFARVQEESEAKERRLDELRESVRGPIESEEELEQLSRQVRTSNFSTAEQKALEQTLEGARDRLEQMREEELLTAKVSLETLEKVLESRQRRRLEIKGRLDELRRKGGSSGLDFESALLQQEMIEENRRRLEEIDGSIDQLKAQMGERQ